MPYFSQQPVESNKHLEPKSFDYLLLQCSREACTFLFNSCSISVLENIKKAGKQQRSQLNKVGMLVCRKKQLLCWNRTINFTVQPTQYSPIIGPYDLAEQFQLSKYNL